MRSTRRSRGSGSGSAAPLESSTRSGALPTTSAALVGWLPSAPPWKAFSAPASSKTSWSMPALPTAASGSRATIQTTLSRRRPSRLVATWEISRVRRATLCAPRQGVPRRSATLWCAATTSFALRGARTSVSRPRSASPGASAASAPPSSSTARAGSIAAAAGSASAHAGPRSSALPAGSSRSESESAATTSPPAPSSTRSRATSGEHATRRCGSGTGGEGSGGASPQRAAIEARRQAAAHRRRRAARAASMVCWAGTELPFGGGLVMRLPLVALAIAVALAQAPSTALAASHLWRFSEFYSSPDRSVQFIEMQEIGGSQDETRISAHWYATNGYNQNHSQLLGHDLPFGTANKKFLVGTQSYAALPGVPAPDYVLPDGFLDPSGDTVVWWFYQTIVIPPGAMPSDGVDSLRVVTPAMPGDPPVYSVGTNSPTNFAGITGTVVLPAQVPSASPSMRGLLASALVGLGLLVLARRRLSPGTSGRAGELHAGREGRAVPLPGVVGHRAAGRARPFGLR